MLAVYIMTIEGNVLYNCKIVQSNFELLVMSDL